MMPLFVHAQCEFLQQKVDVNIEQISAEDALKKLASQYHLKLSYSSGLFTSQLYNISYKNQKLESVIRTICHKQGIEFHCVGSNGLVFSKKLAEHTSILSGFVYDSSSFQPIVGALIVYQEQFVTTDHDGRFQITITQFPAGIAIYSPGYDSKEVIITKEWNTPMAIEMIPNSTLNTAVINVFDSLLMVSKTGGVNINIPELSKIPSIAGSPGVLNSLRFLPSIQSTVEANGGMVVQGGGRDQNLVLFDGMELYNPMHLFGLFSVFDENSLQSISFHKNSIPAQYSGRLSSVLDVKSKVGDFKKWNSKLNINPVLLEGVFHGPIKKDKTSLLVSARRSFTDFFPLFYEQIQTQNELSRFKYYFYDITSTLNHKISDNTNFYLTGYIGGDKGYIRGNQTGVGIQNTNESQNDEFVQSNVIVTTGVKTWINHKLSLHVKAGFSEYGFTHKNDYELSITNQESSYNRYTNLEFQSKIADFKTSVFIKTLPKKGHTFLFGMENVWHNFTPSNSSYFLKENDLILYDTVFQKRNTNILEQRYFLSNKYSKKNLKILSGLHFVNFDNNISYRSLQPRINVSYQLKSKNVFEVGASRTSQFMLFVPNNLLGIPIDIWIPADEKIKPMHCSHFLAAYSRKINKRVVAKLNFYHKIFENSIEYRNGVADFITEWDKALLVGKGRARGAEFMIKKEKGKLNGWFAYTLSKSERTIDEINNGRWFPFQYDRRHDIKGVMHYQLNSNLSLGTTWSYASGNYLTAPDVHYLITIEDQQYLIEQYGNKNNLKLPSYHRLDIGIHHKKYIGKALQTWSFTVYNVYNRQNVFYVNSSINASGSLDFQPISILPVLPSVNYAIKF